MKEVHVGVVIIPDGPTLKDLHFDIKKYGSFISNNKTIQVNKANDDTLDYTVIIRNSVLCEVGPRDLVNSIEAIMSANIKDSEFNYHPIMMTDYQPKEESVTRTDDDESISWLLRNAPWPKDDDPGDDDEDDDYDYDDEDDDYEPSADLFNYLTNQAKPRYYHSASWHNSNNAKKMIRRHGIIVASKKDIHKDERIIRDFLREFFPGNSSWKKEFRADVAKRWVQMFVVTKGQLKKLEKAARKARREKDSGDRVSKALDFTQMLFGTKDHWSDPNR